MEIESSAYQDEINFQESLALTKETKRPWLREFTLNFFAGCFAGVANLTVGHPFDTIKVRMQMINTSFSSCVKDIVHKEGYSALYKGFTSPLLSTPLMRSTGWLSFEAALALQGAKFDNFLPSQGAKAGIFSAFALSFIIVPIELVKTRLQMEGVGAKVKKTGSIQMGKQILRAEGIRGLYKGYTMSILRDAPALAASYSSFQFTKRFLISHWGEKFYNSMIAGSVAGVACWLACYPQDLIKTRIQNGYKGTTIQLMKEIYAKDGLRGFWRGFGACMTRAPIAVAVSYFTYEHSKIFLTSLADKYY